MPLEEHTAESQENEELLEQRAFGGDVEEGPGEPAADEWTPPTEEEWSQLHRERDAIKNQLFQQRARRRHFESELSALRESQGKTQQTLEEIDRDRRARAEAEEALRSAPDPEDKVATFRHQLMQGVEQMVKPLVNEVTELRGTVAEQQKVREDAERRAAFETQRLRIIEDERRATPEQIAARNQWQESAVDHYKSVYNMTDDQARATTAEWMLQMIQQSWARGDNGNAAFLPSQTNGNGGAPESAQKAPRGQVPARAARQRRLAKEAPPEPPRGRAPSDPADPIAAFVDNPPPSDDAWDVGIRKLAQATGMSLEAVEARIEELAGVA